jgi:hypothetical protein
MFNMMISDAVTALRRGALASQRTQRELYHDVGAAMATPNALSLGIRRLAFVVLI